MIKIIGLGGYLAAALLGFYFILKYGEDKAEVQNNKERGSYFLVGHERALCPCSLQIPHLLGLLGGGSHSPDEVMKLVVVVELVVVTVVVVPLLLVEGVVVTAEGSGTLGLGQVTSFASSGQNSLIFWKRYHWRSGESPVGVRSSGRTVEVGDHSCFNSLKSTSGESDLSRAKTCPL